MTWSRKLAKPITLKDGRTDAVRGVLIGAVVGDVAVGLLTIWGMIQGLLNEVAWSSLIVAGLLLLGALYCLSTDSRAGVEKISRS